MPREACGEAAAERLQLGTVVKRAYGTRFQKLTPALARRLAGATVPGLSGQGYMDFWADGSAKQRAAQIELHTVHGVFRVPATKKGVWPFAKVIPAEDACVVTEHHAPGKRSTWAAYLWQGHFGTGGGHDPVWVFV